MDFDEIKPLDCGHVAKPAGICQHNGCGDQICECCVETCSIGNNTLCPTHQRWFDGNSRVLCPSHVPRHVATKLLRKAGIGLE